MTHDVFLLEYADLSLRIEQAIKDTFKENIPKGKQIRFRYSIPLLNEADLVGISPAGSLVIDSKYALKDVPLFVEPLMAALKQLENKMYKIV